MTHLQNKAPIHPNTSVLNPRNWAEHENLTKVFLSQELEESTWKAYARSWTELEAFARAHHQPIEEWTSVIFLHSLTIDPRRKIALGTVYQYAKNISAVGGRQDPPWKAGYLRSFLRILTKLGAKIPGEQAEPLEKDDVYTMLKNDQFTEEEKMTIYVGWKSAARGDDLIKIDPRDIKEVTYEGKKVIVLRWKPKNSTSRVGSGRQKNANGLGHSCVLDCGQYHSRVMRYITRLIQNDARSFSRFKTQEVASILRKIKTTLTAHSMKRGALAFLLEHGVKLEIVTEMARHETHRLPSHTRLYLPPIPLALAMGTQFATRLL
jgi:hypothetical protein